MEKPMDGEQWAARVSALERENLELRERLRDASQLRRCRQEALLVEAERTAHLGCWSLDLTTQELEWSDELCRILGLAPGSVQPSFERMLASIHPEDRTRVGGLIHAGRTGHRIEGTAFRVVRPDGEVRHVKMSGALIQDEVSGRGHLVATALDLTDAIRSEAAVTHALEELRNAQRVAHMGSWTLDPTTGNIDWTPGLYDLLGIPDTVAPSEELFDRHVHPEDLETLHAIRRQIVNGEPVVPSEFRLIQSTGNVLTVVADAQTQYDGEGNPVGFRGVVQDITRRRALEEQLRHSQKMEAVGTLAGGVAHDFNNYLMVISACLETVAAGRPNDMDDAVGAIRRACERCSALTNQLLMFSRKRASRPVVLDLTDLLARMEPILRTALGELNTLVIHSDPLTPHIHVDASLMEQALVNMAVNARDAMPGGGNLTLILDAVIAEADALDERPKHLVRLRVIDDGVGIAREHQSRVFEPFFTTKEAGRGTGLGLATAYGIIEDAGGHISIDSEVGSGTTFTIYLPPTDRQPAAQGAPKPARVPPATVGTVLLVEDVAEVRDVLCRQLERGGFEVVTAENGRVALDKLEHGPWAVDVVLSDVVMPILGGLELERHVRKRYPEIGCVLMTGYSQQVLRERDGDHPVLHKPFTIDELLEVVGAVCAQRARTPGRKRASTGGASRSC